MAKEKKLRLILGDQLNIQHSWFAESNNDVYYVLMEIKSETDYVCHHIQKVLGVFSAMRDFAEKLSQMGHSIIYIKINDTDNLHSFDENCKFLIEKHLFTHFEYLIPDEYRVDLCLKKFAEQLNIPNAAFDTEHFYTNRNEIADLFKNKKVFLMETFYRYIRKKHGILMADSEKPMMEKWNFDHDNREKLPKKHFPPIPLVFSNDLSSLHEEIKAAGIKTIGWVNSKEFIWPINRKQSLELLDFFVENCLPLFGTFQDAMAVNEWSIYHSRLSFAMNIKLISPKEVISKAIEMYDVSENKIAFHQLEGFVRQIVGWREYMRGIYWAKMPEFATLNYFENTKNLPSWFWTGKTNMNCLKNSIEQSLNYAYAHHIQRLMLTGNFALLAGISPDEVDNWYLGIYIDAFEWVEITNTRGMSQYADGGIVGSKPYVSSAAYIHKMSNYCGDCFYDKSIKTGDKACPFNSLYWNFYHQNEAKLKSNPRIGMAYQTWKKMDNLKKDELILQAETYLKNIESL
ncbi:MAG: cryptochrome/photolyase family protein [Pseudarcicella sp.]|nr:cryptochrome/photolyase family protein [Pseudarcicella sp.]